jgi:NTP pyrophosphatase (non-canonical NTP hydrolase)
VNLDDYQKQLDDDVQHLKTPYWAPLSLLARLTEEVGELARDYNHKYGDKVKKPTEAPDDIADEMGDILFTLLCLANAEKVRLDDSIQGAFIKLKTRDADRYEKK